jgi:DNA-binding beta-propeller fold protein YncE
MPIVPMIPPQPVAMYSGFDYVTVDAERRRVYAAHTGSQTLLIVNADTGKEIGQVGTGPMHGVAVNPQTGHVYTGDGESRTVSEVDPVAQKVLASTSVDGNVDAIAYDPVEHRIYADEDDGTRMFVIDSQTMKSVGTVTLPGHKPEYLAIDPQTHKIYQNIANLSEFVVIDPKNLTVVQTIKTPAIKNNHPLQLDTELRHIYVGGRRDANSGVMLTYDTDGNLLGQTTFPGRFDQCDVDSRTHNLYCAGDGGITVFHDSGKKTTIIARHPTSEDVHTVGVDTKTGTFWTVWAAKLGDFIQGFVLK